jgi:hypothetical protein
VGCADFGIFFAKGFEGCFIDIADVDMRTFIMKGFGPWRQR